MTRKYLIRYVRHSYLELEVEGTSVSDARKKCKDILVSQGEPSSIQPELKIGPLWEDIIVRINDKGQRANIPFDDEDNEIEEVDEREWGR